MKILFLSLLVSVSSFGAKPTDLDSSSIFKEILTKSLKERVAWIKEDKINKSLISRMAFNDRAHIKDRWKAIHTLAAVKGKTAKNALLKAGKSEDWFMRDAAIKLSSSYYPKFSTKLARRLLMDPSLIVRTTAVKALHKVGDSASTSQLWNALSDKINFRKGKSLWVRKHIVKALGDFELKNDNLKQADISKFVNLLSDSDERVQKVAVNTLSKLTKTKLGSKNTPHEIHRKRWISWWQKQN